MLGFCLLAGVGVGGILARFIILFKVSLSVIIFSGCLQVGLGPCPMP